MPEFKRGRGRAVVLAPGEPLAQPHPVLVPHGGRGLVTHPPAGRAQPPDEVDVLPHPHVLGETGPGGLLADHQCGAGYVGHPRSRPDDASPVAHVQGGARSLVPRQPGAPGFVRDDARSDRAHRGIGEVRQQSVQPAGFWHAVGVEERHQRRLRRRQAGVPGRCGPAVHRARYHLRPGRGRRAPDRGRVAGAVVHHDHPLHVTQPGQAAGQFGVPVADRDDHRHLRPARRVRLQHGMRDPGVEQPARQRAGLRVARHRRALPPAGHVPRPGRAEPQHPGGVTARDHRPVGQRAGPRIGPQPESRRYQLVAWPLACEDRRVLRLPRAGFLRHPLRLLRTRHPIRHRPLPPGRPLRPWSVRHQKRAWPDTHAGFQERALGCGSR